MVDAIKTTVNRLEPTKGRASEGRSANAGVTTVAPSPSVDKVTVSSVASSKAHTQLAEAPSIDMEAVKRIKDAIARGKYPCLLYTSPSPRDLSTSRMPSSA